MRKFIWPCGVALLCFAAGVAVAVPPPPPPTSDASSVAAEAGNVLKAAKQAGVLRVATEPDFPPLYWVDEAGKEQGFEYELAQRIAKELGIPKVELVEGDYDKLPSLATEGKADIFMAGYVPDNSIEGVSWSDSYLDFGLCLIVPKGSPVKTIKQLKGKTIGAYEDPAATRWIDENIANRKAVKTYMGPGWLFHVDNREVDAAIYDYPLAVEEIKAFKRLQIVSFNLNKSSYAVGFKAGNPDLQQAINTAIKTIEASDDYAGLIKRYLPFKISQEVPEGSATYTIQAGDTLGKIATEKLGSPASWEIIWDLNKHRIPNPNLLDKGDVLIMPKAKEPL
ncbi:transporter substrate-binding and LysM peptidoglycan-binding domain-containing protein [Thiothrix lacustris]|uniref:transporter substrate-binding and LysM peptidoglycan-binding domain-containing protein n=1 Tax=Thiothrix lacustris TaxID=525917 RepID=UPI0027E4A398|nr:transporter substrate-binding domain-containing protein [Thiothrix lacustris]WMP15834.1 transporter substrate-binding domain-containing protein [Thiothrix lacustris]